MSESVDELLRRVDRALDAHAQADQTTRTVESLTALEKQLSPYIEDLRQAVAALGALDQVGRPAKRPQTREVAVACRRAAELVRQDKSGPQDLPRTLRRITDVVNIAIASARDMWREYIDESVPGLDSLDKLAEMLGHIQADPLQATALKRGVRDLRALSRRLPDASAPSEAIAAVDVIYPALTVLLGDSDTDSDIRHFMETVARGGAHVRALTQDVKDWMRRSGAEDSFKVVAGRPAGE